MNEQQRFQHILDECVERVLAGEPIESLAASYPEYASTLMMLLRSVNDMRGAAIGPAASHEARERARAGMLAGITATGSAGQSRAAEQGGVGMWMWFRGRPVVYQGLALLAGVALLGGVAAGASAAGSAPEPVRELFGFREDSAIGVEFTGIVVSVDVTGASLTVTASDDTRVVFVDGPTEISDGGDLIALDDLQPGDVVEVKGSLQADNTILASRLHREDGDDDTDDGRTPTPGATPLPTSDATPGDDDDRDDGNSGPDNHDRRPRRESLGGGLRADLYAVCAADSRGAVHHA